MLVSLYCGGKSNMFPVVAKYIDLLRSPAQIGASFQVFGARLAVVLFNGIQCQSPELQQLLVRALALTPDLGVGVAQRGLAKGGRRGSMLRHPPTMVNQTHKNTEQKQFEY